MKKRVLKSISPLRGGRGQGNAVGSTTGFLWISENSGDGWECVSSHLPSIYSLRFTQ
jgi:hypothetical protein